MKITMVSAIVLALTGVHCAGAQMARQLWLQDGREPKMQPASVSAGSSGFTLAVTGTGFASGAVVLWNNQALSTSFVSATQLTAKVPAALIAAPGTASVTVTGAGVTSPPSAFTIAPATTQARTEKKPKPSAAVSGREEVAQSRPLAANVTPRPNSNSGLAAAPVFTEASLQPLGIRYSFLRTANGSTEEVSPDSTFHSGDWVKVKVEANRDGYLYVVSRGSGGNWSVLFPSAIEAGDNRLTARREYPVPSGKYGFHFDDQVGEEKLFIVYSAQPVEDLDALIYSLRKPERTDAPANRMMAQNSSVNDGVVSRLRDFHSRDLLIDRMPPSENAKEKGGAKPENAVYVVNGSGGRVVADIALRHE